MAPLGRDSVTMRDTSQDVTGRNADGGKRDSVTSLPIGMSHVSRPPGLNGPQGSQLDRIEGMLAELLRRDTPVEALERLWAKFPNLRPPEPAEGSQGGA